jgi:hypothetical protein
MLFQSKRGMGWTADQRMLLTIEHPHKVRPFSVPRRATKPDSVLSFGRFCPTISGQIEATNDTAHDLQPSCQIFLLHHVLGMVLLLKRRRMHSTNTKGRNNAAFASCLRPCLGLGINELVEEVFCSTVPRQCAIHLNLWAALSLHVQALDVGIVVPPSLNEEKQKNEEKYGQIRNYLVWATPLQGDAPTVPQIENAEE